jgi:hypothetical protein
MAALKRDAGPVQESQDVALTVMGLIISLEMTTEKSLEWKSALVMCGFPHLQKLPAIEQCAKFMIPFFVGNLK